MPEILSHIAPDFRRISLLQVWRVALVPAPPNPFCPIRHILGCDTSWTYDITMTFNPEWTCDPLPTFGFPYFILQTKQTATFHNAKNSFAYSLVPNFSCSWYIDFLSWGYLQFWVPGLSLYFFRRLPFIIEGNISPFNLASWTAPPSVTFCTIWSLPMCLELSWELHEFAVI